MRAMRKLLRASGVVKTGKRFRSDTNGATVVEFALVATPFFALLFAIMETALVFFTEQVIELGVSDAARMVRTGQAQNGSFNEQDFRNTVCGGIGGLFDCQNKLKVDVRTFDNFADTDSGPPIDADRNLVDDFVFQPGNGGDIVVVRGFLEWPTFLPSLGNDLSNLANGNRLIMTTVTFRNEPF